MKKLWEKYLAWREKSQQKYLEHWKKTRAKGHPRYVLGTTFIYGSLMFVVRILVDCWYVAFNWWKLPGYLLFYFITGFIIGAVLWWDCERKYQKLLKAKTVS